MEQTKDKFLINIGKTIDNKKRYLKEVIINNDEVKSIKICDNEILLTPGYQNTTNLLDSINNGLDNYQESIKNRSYNNFEEYYLLCFNNFKDYIKDVVNLCYYNIKLNKNNMELVYSLLLKSLEDFNKKININNKYASKLNKIEMQYFEDVEKTNSI